MPRDKGKKKNKSILRAATEIARLPVKPPTENVGRMKALVSIVNRADVHHLKDIIDDNSVGISYRFAATGTAHSSVLDYLGIGETEKSVVLSVIPECDEERIIKRIREEMSLYLVGRGISFTVPLTGISMIVANGLSAAATNKSGAVQIMKSEDRKYTLIVAAVAVDYVDAAIEAAREVGAPGGTIIHARSVENAKAQQFTGFALAREQEILLILVKKELAVPVMMALSDRVGAKTEAGGVIFSLPVDRTAGISVTEAEDSTEKKED